ncbi:MAG: polyprenyl synthetase family protein [Oscillospiraceae bacterium]|nr:polyprenyl synthetase family protein [Oscillospiraceae bacterium]
MMNYPEIIEKELMNCLPQGDERNCLLEKCLVDSMEYSLKAGGKRIRPTLVMLFSKACGGSEESALPFACGIEMIHTYSLIHDDLPCMDDDDLRRGKPSNHKVFGEDIALLAGDALLTHAFSTVLSERAISLVGADRAVKCGKILADLAGMSGMVGGQVIDLISEGKKVPIETISEMHMKKTGALLAAACMMGAVCGGADENTVNYAREYGINLGLAFQIMDDILDVTSSEEALGKPIGSDKDNEKSTFVTLLGLDKCYNLVNEYTEKAINSLKNINANTDELKDIALKLSERKN